MLDDTLVYVIIGDNGASAEGNFEGHDQRGLHRSTTWTTLEDDAYMIAHKDELGTPKSYNHYAIGWAHAMDTPVPVDQAGRLHWGGTRNGTIVSLAERHRGARRDPQPVRPRHRRRADRARGRRHPRADHR